VAQGWRRNHKGSESVDPLQVDAVFGAATAGPGNWDDIFSKLGVMDGWDAVVPVQAAASKAAAAHPDGGPELDAAAVAAHVAPYAAAEEAAMALQGSPRERAFSFALQLAKLLNDMAFLRVRGIVAEHCARMEQVFVASQGGGGGGSGGAAHNRFRGIQRASSPDFALLASPFRGPVFGRAKTGRQLLSALTCVVATESACHRVFKAASRLNVHLERPLALALEGGELTPALLDEARRLVLLEVGAGEGKVGKCASRCASIACRRGCC